MQIYLAGPIAGHEAGPQIVWREDFILRMHIFDQRITCKSPLRGKWFRKTDIMGSHSIAGMEVQTAPSAIVQRDYSDVVTSDIVLVNFLTAESISVGSCFEMAWCYAHHKPLIVVCREDDPISAHPFVIMSAGWIVHDLDAAMEIVQIFFSGGA